MSALFPDAERDKISLLIEEGLDGETIARRFLDGQVPIDLAYFLIDLDLEGEALEGWLNCIAPPLTKEARLKIMKALDSAVPQVLVQTFRQFELTPKAIKNSLYALAALTPPQQLVAMLLDNDFNSYDLHQTLLGKGSLWQRFSRLEELLKTAASVDDILLGYDESINYDEASAMDLLILARAMGLESGAYEHFSESLGVTATLLKQQTPQALQAQLRPDNKWRESCRVAFKNSNRQVLGSKLIGREKGRSRWFQTVGPNVLYVYTGVLHRQTPGTSILLTQPVKDIFNLPAKSLKHPDFQIIFYADGGVRAKHIGIDGLRSNEHQVLTIGHAYEGAVEQNRISLIETNDYAPHPERPTLGDLILTDLQREPTGMTVSFKWRGKTAVLNWDPGY